MTILNPYGLRKSGIDVPFGLHYSELEIFITDKAKKMGILDDKYELSIKDIEVNKEESYLVINTELMEHNVN